MLFARFSAQHRKRIYIVAIREDLRNHEYVFPEPTNEVCDIHTIIDEPHSGIGYKNGFFGILF